MSANLQQNNPKMIEIYYYYMCGQPYLVILDFYES